MDLEIAQPSILSTLTLLWVTATACLCCSVVESAEPEHPLSMCRSIRSFGVLPENTAAVNTTNLQAAIDWAAPRGAALFVEYTKAGGQPMTWYEPISSTIRDQHRD